MALFDKDGKKAKTLVFYEDKDKDLLADIVNNSDFLDFNNFTKKLCREALVARKAQIEPVTLDNIEKRVKRIIKSELANILANITINQTTLPSNKPVINDDKLEDDLAAMF